MMRAPLGYRLLATAVAVAAGAAIGIDLGARLAVDAWRERREARRGRIQGRARRAPRQPQAAWREDFDAAQVANEAALLRDDPLQDPTLRALGALARERRAVA